MAALNPATTSSSLQPSTRASSAATSAFATVNRPPVVTTRVLPLQATVQPVADTVESAEWGSIATTDMPAISALLAIRRPARSAVEITARPAKVPSKSRAFAAS